MKAVLETWKPIMGYDDYEVSDYGCVRSLKYGKVRYLKCSKDKNGYTQICLCKNNKKKTFLVHRLVYTEFNGTVPEGMQLDHIDGDKTNNTIANLRAVSPKVNTNNPVTRVRHLEAIKKRTLSEEWRQKNCEKNRRLAKDPKWRQKNREANRQNAKDPEWLQKNREAAKKRSQNQEWLQKNREANRRKAKDSQWLQKNRDANRRRLNKPVLQLDKKTEKVIRRWECAADAWREIGVYYGNISACCLGRQKTAAGFRWKFATGDD